MEGTKGNGESKKKKADATESAAKPKSGEASPAKSAEPSPAKSGNNSLKVETNEKDSGSDKTAVTKGNKQDTKPEQKPDSKSNAKSAAKADAKPETKSDAKPASGSQPEVAVKPDAKSEAKVSAKAEVKAEPKATEAKTEPKAESKAEGKAEQKVVAKTEPKAGPKPKALPDAKPGSEIAKSEPATADIESVPPEKPADLLQVGTPVSTNLPDLESSGRYEIIASIRSLLEPKTVAPSREDLMLASQQLKLVEPYNYEVWRLHADLLLNAIHLLETRELQPDAHFTLLAIPLREEDLRDAAEAALRQCAHFAPSHDKRIELIDEANSVRNTTWF